MADEKPSRRIKLTPDGYLLATSEDLILTTEGTLLGSRIESPEGPYTVLKKGELEMTPDQPGGGMAIFETRKDAELAARLLTKMDPSVPIKVIEYMQVPRPRE